MARVIAGCSVPHNPFLPVKVKEDPEGINARCFAQVAEAIGELEPDLVVTFSPDHLNTIFFDNLPTILIGIVEEFAGPNDDYPPVEPRTLASDPDLARHVFHHALRSDFDLSRSESLQVDHSVLVPLQIMEISPVVVPIILNVLAPPVMNATRAHAFGRAVGEAIRSYDRDLDVLVLADGGVIQEVAGPRIRPGKPDGAPGQEWLARVTGLLGEGDVETVLAEATPRQIAEAGNAAGELLTVLAMLGALGDAPGAPRLIEAEPETGHMFGFWEASR